MSPKNTRSSGLSVMIPLVIILAGLGAGLYILFKDTSPPLAELSPNAGPVSLETGLDLTIADPGSGLAEITVAAVRGDDTEVLLKQTFGTAPSQVTETIALDKLRFSDGEFSLAVKATDGSFAGFGKGNTLEQSWVFDLDTKAPRISVQSLAHNVKQGGAGAVSYSLNEAVESTGVRVGDLFFPGYEQENGSYVCLFAFPYFVQPDAFAPVLTARDAAGNERVQKFAYTARPRNFKEDVINLPDSFLERKMPEFEADIPGRMSHLERYLKVNRELRKANRDALLTLGQASHPKPLWTELSFVRMAGKPMAGFGDHRYYKYNGETVDEQTHLGVDIAALRNFPVPAANAGEVIFADVMGIYGQCVIIDHGLGLMTLYAHLSSIDVETGDMVQRDQTIGKSGMTGLAGGDHLHFGVLVSGLPVTPVEWWDGHWVKVNVADRL